MRDFDYEVRQRKTLARQSRYRKCGSKCKGCKLSTDGMTRRQWEKRNGEVVTYKLNKPMTWAEFRSMDKDIQLEYICSLIDKYDISVSAFAQMFDVTVQNVRSYLRGRDLSALFSQGRMKAEQKEVWQDFLSGRIGSEPGNDTTITEQSPTIPPAEQERPSKSMDMTEVVLVFSGELDYNDITNSLKSILGDTAVGRLSVSFSKAV